MCEPECISGFLRDPDGVCVPKCISGFERNDDFDCVPKCPKGFERWDGYNCIEKCESVETRDRFGVCYCKSKNLDPFGNCCKKSEREFFGGTCFNTDPPTPPVDCSGIEVSYATIINDA